MDLIGPIQTKTFAGKRYVLVCVDDFSRYIWTRFMREKYMTLSKYPIIKLQNDKKLRIKATMSDHGRQFENSKLTDFCNKSEIKHTFSVPIRL